MFRAKDIMTQSVVCTRPEMPIYDAVRLLTQRKITGMPVVDDELNIVGVLSEKDVLGMLYATEDSIDQRVSDYMNVGAVSLDVNDTLIDLCDCMTENVFRRVFITNEGKLAGVVSRSDVINAILRLKHQAVAK
jgi:CBS domain-containing protein